VAADGSSDIRGATRVDLDPEPDASHADHVGAESEVRVVAVAADRDLSDRLVGVPVGRCPASRRSQDDRGQRTRSEQNAQSEDETRCTLLQDPSADPESYSQLQGLRPRIDPITAA
jgi:hypothetical protein